MQNLCYIHLCAVIAENKTVFRAVFNKPFLLSGIEIDRRALVRENLQVYGKSRMVLAETGICGVIFADLFAHLFYGAVIDILLTVVIAVAAGYYYLVRLAVGARFKSLGQSGFQVGEHLVHRHYDIAAQFCIYAENIIRIISLLTPERNDIARFLRGCREFVFDGIIYKYEFALVNIVRSIRLVYIVLAPFGNDCERVDGGFRCDRGCCFCCLGRFLVCYRLYYQHKKDDDKHRNKKERKQRCHALLIRLEFNLFMTLRSFCPLPVCRVASVIVVSVFVEVHFVLRFASSNGNIYSTIKIEKNVYRIFNYFYFCEKYPSFCFPILIIYKIYGILIPYYRKRQRGKQKKHYRKEDIQMKRKEQNGDIAIMLPPEGKFARFWFRLKHSEYLYLLAAFFLPFTILLGVYACLGTHPFGNSSVLTLDLQAQYIYYYEEIRRLLTQGGSWLYSWKRTLGGEFMGIVAYYGASPLNIIFALFPKDRIADAMMTIQLFKVGFMGLTFGYYIHKTRFVSQMHTIAFSLMYALCAYSVVQLANPMWLDAMIFLPLLILGLEALINERKFILYTASLTMIFITNYYIGYMCGIFTFFYFLYYYSLKRDDLMYKGEEKISLFKTYGFRTFMRFAFFTLISLLIAAFMLIAAYYSLTFGKSGFSNPSYSFSLRFDFLDLIVKLLPGSYDSVRPTGLPMIYSGLLALIAIPLYYMSPAITKKQKVCASMLLAVLLFSFSINVIDLVWHGFSAPNWLNYRYSFVSRSSS